MVVSAERAEPLGPWESGGAGSSVKQAWCQDAQLEHQRGRGPGLHCGLSFPNPGFPGVSSLWALQGVLLLSQEGPVTFPSSLQIYSW